MNHSFFCFNTHVRSAILAGLFTSFQAMATAPCEAASPPPNDNLANAQVITGNSFTVSGTLEGATQEGFEQTADYMGLTFDDDLNASVWYTWTPSVSGVIKVNPSTSTSHQTPVLLFKGPGTPSVSTFVGTNAPGVNDFSANVTANQQYFFSVAIESQAEHPFTLAVTLTPQSTSTPAPTPTLTPTPILTPVVTLAVKTPKVSRSSGAIGKVYVELSSAAAADLSIAYKTSGTAVNGADYKMLSGNVTVPAGATQATLKIKPRPGNTNTLSLKLTVTAGDGYTVGESAKGKIKIVE